MLTWHNCDRSNKRGWDEGGQTIQVPLFNPMLEPTVRTHHKLNKACMHC